MPTRLPPALNLAVLCSYVEFDAEQRPFSLVEPLYALSSPADGRGRLRSHHFSLFVQLDDEQAVGTFWIAAEARTTSGIVLPNGRTPPIEVTFTGNPDPTKAVELVFASGGWCSQGRAGIIFMCCATTCRCTPAPR